MLRRVDITRYITPLREGSSLPALVEADDEREYVIKFRGAGHGEKALIAELVVGEIGRALGLPVPEIVLATLPEEIARAESHDEIRDLLGWSVGLNIGLAFVPGALASDVTRPPAEGADWAADVVWFDDLTINPDRTPRNANLVVGDGRTWLIDHGAAFFRQHGGRSFASTAHDDVPMLTEHVLLPYTGSIRDADERLASRALAAAGSAVALVPPAWLGANPASRRGDFAAFLTSRLAAPRGLIDEIERARG